MSSSRLPRFPVEIIDPIVKAVISDHSSSLASLASTAHSIRHIVNATRFFRVGAYLNFATVHTKHLAGILSTDSAVWPVNERAVRYIRVLDALLEPPYSQDTPMFSVRRYPSGLFLSTIFDAIARAHGSRRQRNPRNGLRIRIFSQRMRLFYPVENISIVAKTPFIYSLSETDVEIQGSLQQLCTSVDAETIELKDLLDAPDDLTLFAGASTLVIDRVSLSLNPHGILHPTDLPFQNIRKLIVHNSPSFLQILGELQDASLPTLEALQFYLNGSVRQTDVDPWSWLATKTKALSIEIGENSEVPRNSLFRDPCRALKNIYLYGCMRLFMDGGSWFNAHEEVESAHTPAFLNAALLLPFTLPPLVDICITVNVSYCMPHHPKSMAHKALDHVYRSVHHPELVECLTSASRKSRLERACIVLEVKFTYFSLGNEWAEFDWEEAEHGYEQYLHAKFRPLRDMEAVALYIRVHMR